MSPMKTLTKYVAADGAEFASAPECEAYENICARISAIVGRLEPA
jgi:hypothetical protein